MTNACLRLMPTAIALFASLVMPSAALAQQAPAAHASAGEAANPSASAVFRIAPAWLDATAPMPVTQAPEAACADCPRRRPGFAAIETLGVNVLFNLMNRALRPAEEREQFKVGFSSWWDNLKYGFEWDDNAFQVNQIGHPYQGGLYFNAARSNGMSFWESAPYAALGSATWEFFGETHHASMNDFITTTVGGMAIGEMLYRAGWLVRDTTKSGGARTKNEILAMLIDPVTGANRFLSGDAKKVSERPSELSSVRAVSDLEAGVLWRGDNTRAVNATGEPYLQMNLAYGDLLGTSSRAPFDAFNVDVRFGGGSAISEANIRGRLYGRRFGKAGEPGSQFMVMQAYSFSSNNVYEFGGQSVGPAVTNRHALSDRSELITRGGGGVMLLGAFSSPFVFGENRDYDFGPGLVGTANAVLRVDGFPVARLAYSLVYLHVVSGTAGDHVAQSVAAEGLVPLRRQLRLGASVEYIRRKIYYDYESDVDDKYPQFRVYLAWVNK